MWCGITRSRAHGHLGHAFGPIPYRRSKFGTRRHFVSKRTWGRCARMGQVMRSGPTVAVIWKAANVTPSVFSSRGFMLQCVPGRAIWTFIRSDLAKSIRTGSARTEAFDGLKNQTYREVGSESGSVATTALRSTAGNAPRGRTAVR